MTRHRGVLLPLLIVTIALGLASRRFGSELPHVVSKYAGDTLWATMMFWILALAFPRAKTMAVALGALSISFAVECSQLYHAGWIDAIRATTLGALALGSGFLWSDLACYTVGVAIALAIDVFFLIDR